jgi:glycosyltransferase involved in cell wall biosynthesis
MPAISIITPAYNPEPEYLLAACESLKDQKLPDDWEWEWIVQQDEKGETSAILPRDSRIKIQVNRHAGVAITRNLALARTMGVLVKNLDQDDVLTPGSLARDIEAFTENPEIQWTTSRALDLLPDGSTAGFDHDPNPGRLEPGMVVEHWRAHDFRLPVHPTTICIRRSLAVALGGWMAIPGSDDTGLLIAASVVDPGYFIGEVGLLYRKWPGQESATAAHTEPIEWNARMSLISERADALRALLGDT